MQKSHVVLIIVASVTALVFAWQLWLRPSPPLEVTVLADRSGTLSFILNDRVRFEELRVYLPERTDAEGNEVPEAVMWHMVPRENPPQNVRPINTLIYGEPRGLGLRPSPGVPVRGTPLERGKTYILEFESDGGDATAEFVLP